MNATHRIKRSLAAGLTCLFGTSLLSTSCTHPLQRDLEAYRSAKKRGDYQTAAKYMVADARIWFKKKDGPGRPLRPEGGPYKNWDEHFNSTNTCRGVQVIGHTVTYISQESNDFYRLIDGKMGPARITYYFDQDNKITGMLYEPIPQERLPNRRKEFEAWAAREYPGLLDSDEMQIPNNPQRWRELLIEWRAAAGLPPIG